MRKFLIVFMVMLLALRGLVGDAMATGMAAHGLKSVVGAAEVQPVVHAPGMPCHEVVGDGSGVVAAADGSECSSCQACHLSAAVACGDLASVSNAEHLAPAQVASLWRSAELRLLVTPPVT